MNTIYEVIINHNKIIRVENLIFKTIRIRYCLHHNLHNLLKFQLENKDNEGNCIEFCLSRIDMQDMENDSYDPYWLIP